MTEKPYKTFLKDWKRSPFHIPDVHLQFDLDEKVTLVTAKLRIKAVEDRQRDEPLILNGEDVELKSIHLNGKKLEKPDFILEPEVLILYPEESEFLLEIKTKIHPQKNTQLSGLYQSGDILCTQNEAEGFRRITYFIDRPDIMSRYTVEIVADQKKYPYLLSNGNCIESGVQGDGRHYVKWQDPFLKPCYLFALVAGDFGLVKDTYRTRSLRNIDLKIFCDKGNEDKCHHAMNSLKKAMQWDERVFGLEYDLDLFMIVAVLSFNFGAMENKGLNIFNANAILADPKTSTDENYFRVERIVAHEYFHNWTGNRVTLRDWFQLTLKEGLTVFRDQEFTQDMHDPGVGRIEDVHYLRRFQFPEDSGPTKHPVKPDSYIKIDNFYTTTVYQKGAEIVRMIKTLLGGDLFRKGMDIYFARYDGMAVTTEDFLSAMEEAYGESLQDFSLWYTRSGTPIIEVRKIETEEGIALEIVQKNLSQLPPLTFPMAVGFIDPQGSPIPLPKDLPYLSEKNTAFLKVTEERALFPFPGIPKEALSSLNRHFSAPIKVERDIPKKERHLLMRHDNDAFTRWDAAYELYSDSLLNLALLSKKEDPLKVDIELLESLENIFDNKELDPAYKALMLSLPTEAEIGEKQDIIDIKEIHEGRNFLKKAIGKRCYTLFLNQWKSLSEEHIGFDSFSIGKRKLKNSLLAYLVATEEEEAFRFAFSQFERAKNMTDEISALELLAYYDNPYRSEALTSFYKRWKDDPLVITKWFAVQAGSQRENTSENVKELLKDPCYDEKVPNFVRALLGTFLQNQFQFHDVSGRGYQLISQEIIHLDTINSHVSANLAQGFRKYAKLDPIRKKKMESSLEEILKITSISPNVFEIVSKCLGKDI